MSPTIRTIPSRRPMKSRPTSSAGTNLATGFPRLVITTGSRVLRTSSINARHRALNSLAGILFMTSSKWTLVIITWSHQRDHEYVTFTATFSSLNSIGFPAASA